MIRPFAASTGSGANRPIRIGSTGRRTVTRSTRTISPVPAQAG
nr:hypothetical protein [Sphingomonas sp. J315]